MGDSHVWADLLKIKDIYLRGRSLQTKNGKNTILWTDSWLGDKPLCLTYPVLYDLCSDKDITIFDFLRKNGQIRFSRRLPPILFSSWVHYYRIGLCSRSFIPVTFGPGTKGGFCPGSKG